MHKFITKYSPDIAKAYRNAKCKMLSPKIQNDILQAAAIALVQEIKIEILDSDYSILADETRDSCSNELVAVCIRYLHRGDIREWLLVLSMVHLIFQLKVFQIQFCQYWNNWNWIQINLQH